MEIKNYKKKDEFLIKELFEKVFLRPFNLDVWRWRFEKNPVKKNVIKTMWDGDRLIAHYSASCTKIMIEEKEYLSALTVTLMTDPDYRGKGIFHKLSNALNEELERDRNMKAILAFPNINSHYGFTKFGGLTNLGLITSLGLPLDAIEAKLNNKINQFEIFTSDHEKILTKITSKFPVCIKRDVEYLTWRYNEKPNVKYYKFEYIENEVKCFIIVKKYPSSINGVYDLFITELGIDMLRLSLLPFFISHLAAFFGQKDAVLYTWLSIFDERYIHLEKLGFHLKGKTTYMGVRARNEKEKVLIDMRNWYFSYGDSDVY